MRYFVFLCTLALTLSMPGTLYGSMTGGNYEIYGDVFSSFEDSLSTGGNYALFETGGESGSNMPTGGSFILKSGFQALERGTATLTLSTTTISLGQLSAASVASSTVTTTVSVDSFSGYSLTISESGNLTSGAQDIDDVADGAVTAGSEEYGIQTSGVDGQLAVDTAITGASLPIASNAGFVSNSATAVIFKASIDTSRTRQGNYSHTVTFTLTANP